MTRPNVPFPTGGRVRFVGGVPSRYHADSLDLDRVYEGEAVGAPMFSDGMTWVRVHVPGVGDDVLVSIEHLRP